MRFIALAGAAIATPLLPSTAFAHHPLGGLPMETLTHGLLSGIGHPLLGFDHLFFVLLVSVAALYTGYRKASPAAYIAAMLVGCLAMSMGIGLPAKELVVGLSLLVLGGLVLSGKAISLIPAMALFAAFGLFHGSAFGDSIVGQEGGIGGQVLIGYLIGLGVVQYALAIAAGWFVSRVLQAAQAEAVQARLSGAVVAGVGLFLTLENVEGIVFDLFGWAT